MNLRGASSPAGTPAQPSAEPTPIDPSRPSAGAKRTAAAPRSGGLAHVRRSLRATLAGVPRAAWSCAAIAILSAACWSIITPPFQAPDEQAHFSYAQYLAETGHLPSSNADTYSPEESAVLVDLHQGELRWHPEVRTISSPEAVGKLRRDLAAGLPRVGGGGAGVAASEPPLYYALAAIPYTLGSSGNLLERLELIRLMGALMAGLTALFTFLFVREALPRVRWAWTVGGLAAALMPLLGFTSGFLTPDGMLYAVCAAIFFWLARAFRRGLTWKPASALGALIGIGFLTKLNFIGLAPGIFLGLVVLGVRGVRETPNGPRVARAFGPMALAIGIAMSPICLYVVFNLINGHRTFGLVTSAVKGVSERESSVVAEIVYIWEFYLPRLPGMTDNFPGLSTIRQVWFNRVVGLYGWLDTTFPPWVYTFALLPAGAMAALALRSLIACRSALRRRLPELLVYVVICVGLMALIGGDSKLASSSEGAGYAQPRYLMPLLPLAAAMVALAARGAGRRWGPVAGALIVTVFFAQEIFGQLLTVARFYG